ncbi:MAG: N-6 DNA methylase, partial [Promethearchaeota archaeon]
MTIADKLSFSKNALNNYAKKVGELINKGIANEESFYPDFRDLLKDFFSLDEFDVIVVPKMENPEDKPDLIVYMNEIPIINIEAKNPYDPIEEWLKFGSKNRLFKQVYRFRGRENGKMPVLITDFLQIWIIDKDTKNSINSDHQVKYRFKIVESIEGSWKANKNAKKNLEIALNYLCEEIALSITKVKSMIPLLVKYAKELKIKILEIFKDTTNPMKRYLESIRLDFLESIFSADKEKKSQEFADLLAQTLIYGGFLAWMRFCKEGNDPKDFKFDIAVRLNYLPYGTFTHNLFTEISSKSSPEIQEKIIKKIERIFQSSRFEKITENTETLMITFYSDFLKQYDPKIAKDRGIVYTPYPIINFIIRSIDYFLKEYFNKNNGIIAPDVYFLDPAAGTMGFPCEIVRFAKNYFKRKFSKQPGRILNEFNEWVQKIFLKNMYAFEILMAPYVLGHLRINILFDELGAQFDPSREKVKLYLFNSLMELQTKIEHFRNPAIGEEILEALKIRNNKKVLVIMGNPPYNVSTQNRFNWIEQKLKIYYENIQRKGRKKLSGLTSLLDDYIKFIRFAQWKIAEQNKQGIIAFIT